MKSDKLNTAVKESRILSAIRSFVKYTADAFSNSLLCSIIAPRTNSTMKFGKSFSGGLLEGQTRRNSRIKKVLRFIASGFENSMFSKFCQRVFALFLNMRLRSIGLFFLAYSLFSVFALIIMYSASGTEAFDDFITVIAIGGAAIPLSFSKRSLIASVSAARVIGPIFRESFGIDTEKKARDVAGAIVPKKYSGLSVIAGILTGVMTVVLPPSAFLNFIAFGLIFLFIMAVPEAGVISTVASMPLTLTLDLGKSVCFILIFMTVIGYVGKLIRGKRTFSVGLLDVAVFTLFALIFASCFGIASSYVTATEIVIFMLVYFLSVNLIRNRVWQKRMARALVFSWVMIAFVGVMIPILNNTPFLSDILSISVVSESAFVFGRPSESVYFLLPAIPFILTSASDSKEAKYKYLLYFFAAVILVCILLGGNAMPFVPLCVGLAVYAFCLEPAAVFAAFPIGLVCFALQGIRIPFISDALAASVSYANGVMFENKYVRGGVIRALADNIFTGIGMGDETFSKVYANYSYAGFEGATHSGGSFFGFLLGEGLIGTVIFTIVFIIFLRECCGFVRYTKDTPANDRRYVAAALSSVCMIGIAAFADNVFANTEMYVYLWAIIALGISFIRMSRTEDVRRMIRHDDTPDKADAEMMYVRVNQTTNNKGER